MPNDVYSNIVRFVAVAPAAVVALPHTLNVKGVAKIPDVVAQTNGFFSVVVTSTTVTVQNNGPVAADCDVWCWWIYSVLRVFDPITADAMTPAPFVIGGGAGNSNSNFLAVATSAVLSALPGPAAAGAQYAYVAEFDAIYRWVAADVTAADTYRVISHTGGVAGRWILDGNRVTLSPRGPGLDDWARLAGAWSAMAYQGEVWMNAGAWRCDTKQVVPNGTILRANEGVTVTSTLAPNPPGGAEDACPFYNSGGTAVGDTTTLAANANPGDTTINVVSAAAINVGDRLNLRNGTTRRCAREVIGKAGNVLTLDRPVLRPYVIGNGVAVLPTCRDIIIHGGGMRVTGTGDRVVEFISAWDCLVEDVRADVTMNFFVFGYDVASRDSHFVRCTVDCNGTTPAGYALEYAEECSIQDGYSYRPSTYNILLVGCDDCYVRGGYHTTSGSVGLLLSVNIATDTLGCRGCVIEGVAFTEAATHGVVLQDGSSDNTLVGVDSSFNGGIGFFFTIGASGSPPARNKIIGGIAERNPTAAVFTASTGKGNKVIGQSAEDNGSAGNVYAASAGCELDIHDCVISDATILPSVAGMILASGANTIVRVSGVYATTTRAAGVAPFCEVQGGARLFVDGPTYYVGTAVSLGIYVVNGVARVSGFTVIAAGGGSGFFLAGATAYARVADDVDASGATTPFVLVAGAYNRGQIALTAAVALPIAFGNTNATDRFFWHYVTNVGATGVVIAGAPVVGTGFNIVGLAGDTSLINYEIR